MFLVLSIQAQEFSRKDSLRGTLTPVRTCYDVTYYHLKLSVKPDKKYIEGFSDIHFKATSNFTKIQIDLFENMNISTIEFEGEHLNFNREFNAVFIHFNRMIQKGEQSHIQVYFNGNPREAVNPPWDGGFSWKKDENGKDWIGVSCQGLGASSWWPNKDHQSDEPDSMLISCQVPAPLKCIANGNLRFHDLRKSTMHYNTFHWFVSYPINNYNITLNIGDYTSFSDKYISGDDTLALDYYVLPYNKEKAEEHFKQVKPMMECFERYFGKYPFWKDGYALVETPYLGMEHQSAIAYGNDYLPGYHGNKRFIAGLDFDFIIVHESGHEWWGNAITTNDIADMWVHEGFCTYSEVLYVECIYGYDTMLKYVKNQKRAVRNDKPVIGPYHVNKEGSGDMYQKASLMLHTLRTLIDNDPLWFEIIKEISTNFKYQTIDGQDIIDYINQRSGKDFTSFFNQYLKNKDIPEFQYRLIKNGREVALMYKWEAVEGFEMPLLINFGNEDNWILPVNQWKEVSLGVVDIDDFRVVEELFFIDIKKVE